MKYEYGNWFLAIFIVVIFLVFLKSVFQPRTKTDWGTYNSFSAFVIALFAEMYGFPLSIYLLTTVFGKNAFNLDFSHDSGHILNTILNIGGDPHMSWLHLLSNGLTVGGFLLLSSSWSVLYRAQKKNILAITGPYGFIRHPQYAGFVLVIVGFLLQWPTLITIAMAPILIFRYVNLAREEELEMIRRFGNDYKVYKTNTPSFFPSLKAPIKL